MSSNGSMLVIGSYKKAQGEVCLLCSPGKEGSRASDSLEITVFEGSSSGQQSQEPGFSEHIPELGYGIACVSLHAFSPCRQPLPALHLGSTYCSNIVVIFPLNTLIIPAGNKRDNKTQQTILHLECPGVIPVSV